MRQIRIEELRKTDLSVKEVSGAKQNWKHGESYEFFRVPRWSSGFLLILCKRATYTLPDGEQLIAEKNSVVYMPQGCRYLVRFEQEEQPISPASLVLHFHLLDGEKTSLVFGDAPTVWTTDENGVYGKLFLRVIEDYLAGDKLLVNRDFFLLLDELTQALEGASNPLRAVLDYIGSELEELPSVQKLAQRFAMSESTLRRAFAKEMGCSPVQYIHGVKIDKAKRMLALPENTIEEIGAQLGFFDAAHFNKVFRRYAGCSPKKYRESMLSRYEKRE